MADNLNDLPSRLIDEAEFWCSPRPGWFRARVGWRPLWAACGCHVRQRSHCSDIERRRIRILLTGPRCRGRSLARLTTPSRPLFPPVPPERPTRSREERRFESPLLSRRVTAKECWTTTVWSYGRK